MKKLNIGCETEYREGWINLDFDKRVPADVYHDLNKFPWPFKDNEFDEVLASAILEHLTDFQKTMIELYRISKNRGLIYILVPHASEITNSWGEIEHKRPFSYHTFGSWWANKELIPYFEVLKRKLVFTRINFKFMNKIFNPLINLSPQFYERMLSGILPCGYVVYILRVRKDETFQNKQRRIMEKLEKKQGGFDNYKFIREI